jgi:predicted Ser/Thr protein kinase
MLEPGTQIAGYRIDEFIAAGGMGAVYRATQLSLERVVALKLLSEHLSGDLAFRERFRREAVLQAALEHPHIVPVYEAGEHELGLYIAMRFLDGPSLEQLIGTLDRAGAVALLRGIASALDAAHAAGLVHRDLKPQNILVVRDHAYLADFGLTTATGLTSMTSAGQFLGTLDYVSPEQIRDEEPDARSDIYSLGAVLYRCLTGTVPFPRSTKVAVIYAHLEQLPSPASQVAPELPARLDDVLARALAKRAQDRYASAGELVAAVGDALEGVGGVGGVGGGAGAGAPARTGPVSETESTTAASPVTVSPNARPRGGAWPRARPRGGARPRRARAAGIALALAWIAGAGLLAAVAGYAAGRASSSAPSLGATRRLTADGVSVSIPARWSPRTVALPELFPGTFAAAGPAGANAAVAAVGLSRGFGPSMVPQTLRAVPGVPALGSAVRVSGGSEGRIYRFQSPQRRYEILFVPTDHLVATAACIAPRHGPDGGLFARCDELLGGLKARGALALDPRPAYAQFLNSTLGALTAAARPALGRLRGAARAPGQAAAAAALSAAFTSASRVFQTFVKHGLSPPELGVHVGIRNKLAEVAAAYHALGVAAAGGDRVGYRAARQRIGVATQDLAARLYELTRSGYTLS